LRPGYNGDTTTRRFDGDALSQGGHTVDRSQETFTKAQEVRSFLFLTAVMAPLLAVLIVAGYGFLVWIYQMFAGPPGPMGR